MATAFEQGVKAIKPDWLYQLTIPIPFSLTHVHLYVIKGSDSVSLIDAGVNTPEARESIEDGLKELGIKFTDIEKVFISHFHSDHCGLAGWYKEKGGTTIYMGEVDANIIEGFQERGGWLDGDEVFYIEHGYPEDQLTVIVRTMGMFKDIIVSFKVDIKAPDGDEITLSGKRFNIIRVPGHTSGLTCLYMPEEKIFFSTDHVLKHITPNVTYESDISSKSPLDDYLASLEKVRDLEVKLTLPSHGPIIDDLPGRIDEIIKHHEERAGLMLKCLDNGPISTFDISRKIFPDVKNMETWLAFGETVAHMVHLDRKGLVELVIKGDKKFYQRAS